MSAIRRPRASFRGVFTTNVPTANNDKVSIVLDEPNIDVVNPPEVVPPNAPTPAAQLPKLGDGEYRKLMMQTITVNQEGTATTWLNSYFNYFGDSGLSFTASKAAGMPYVNTIITSSVLPGGKNFPQEGKDLFIGGEVQLWGDPFFDNPGSAKMVDLDPIGIYGTQIFSGEVRVVDPVSGKPMLSGKDPTRAYIRAMYMDRNITPPGSTLPPGAWLGGAIWQLGLPLQNLTFYPDYLAPSPKQSPTLMALKTAAEAGQGLLMRFAMYFTIDGIDEGALAKKFAASGYKDPIMNPATGMLVGSIGAWEKGEIASMPMGRLLYPCWPITRPPSNYVLNISMRDRSPLIKADSGTPAPPPHYLAPAVAVVDTEQKTVILDLLTTIPENSSLSDPQPLQKANFGNLTLTILSNGSEQTVATIAYEQYNRAAYEQGSGIIEIPYSPALAPALADPKGIFRLYGQTLGTQPVMQEIDYGSVFTDEQCLYLHEGESITYNIQVLYKGQPVRKQKVAISTSEYQFVYAPPAPGSLPVRTFQPLDNSTGKEFVVSIPPQPTKAAVRKTPNSTAANPRVYYTTDANGMITLTVQGLHRGAAVVRYQLDGDDFDPNMGNNTPPLKYPYFGLTFYNNFRVLPNDNYDNVPDSQITWDFVYQEVIQYFYLLYPGMFARLAFQNEEIARNSASLIRQMVSKRTWDSTSYMPVSRDLSDGKRKLLQRWCALQE